MFRIVEIENNIRIMNGSIQVKPIESIQDLLSEITYLQTTLGFEKIWFRGIADSSYGLEPSIFRKAVDATKERELLNKFKVRARPNLQNFTDEYWEWLFVMQHYGVPTRLLDWTESAIVSLAFAVIYREDKHLTKDAAIWCLDPIKLNRDHVKGFRPTELIPNVIDKTAKKIQVYEDPEIKIDFPVAIYGPVNNERIATQKGVFTLFPFKDAFKIEDLADSHKFLYKLTIAHDKVDFIKKQLLTLGMSETMIYPGLDSLSKEVVRDVIG